jgi:hypothetical protein
METIDDAHCMACRKAWSREVLVNNFSRKFVSTTYKMRRENLLLERERSMMPATQPYAEIAKTIKVINAEVSALRNELDAANDDWHRIANQPLAPLAVSHGVVTEFEAEFIRHRLSQEQRKVVNNMLTDIQHLEWKRQRLEWRLSGGGGLDGEKRQFVRACPYTGCKGFLSTAWKCGLCANWTCPTCHEGKGSEKDAPHECDANAVATAELLAKDSRNCPKCASLIFKINGCDQMFCTQCHTAFSWRTGRVETGTIHNPHYYEFQRAHGGMPRNPGDVPCGGMPDWRVVVAVPGLNAFPGNLQLIANAHRIHGHIVWALRPRWETHANDNRDLRIKFMIEDLSEDGFKKKIQQREKARQRKADILQVVDMLTAVLVDLFQAFVQTRDVLAFTRSLHGLRDHYNTTLNTVSKRYSDCSVPLLYENYVAK